MDHRSKGGWQEIGIWNHNEVTQPSLKKKTTQQVPFLHALHTFYFREPSLPSMYVIEQIFNSFCVLKYLVWLCATFGRNLLMISMS